jgi:hypothetical protein
MSTKLALLTKSAYLYMCEVMRMLKLKHRVVGGPSDKGTAHDKKVVKLIKDLDVAAKRSPYGWAALIVRSVVTGTLYGCSSFSVDMDANGHKLQPVDLYHSSDAPVAIVYPFEDGRWALWGDFPMPDDSLIDETASILGHLSAKRERMQEEAARLQKQAAHLAKPWKAGDQLSSIHGDDKGPYWTVLSVKGEWVTVSKGNEQPIRRKVYRNDKRRTIRVGMTFLVRRGWAA